MALETAVLLIVYGIAIGFVVFLVLYIGVAKAHRNPFGRSFLAFMGSFGAAFGYAIFGSAVFKDRSNTLLGWLILLFLILVVVWLQVWELVSRLRKRSHDDEVVR